MNKRNLFWLHSTKSGLADRLIDFYLMVSYAKLNNANLNLVWEPQDNYTKNQLNVWNEYRFHDYKIENLIQYFKFPENVKFLESMEVSEDAIIFKDYLGGVHSVKSFYEKYCKRNCSLSHFSNIFLTRCLHLSHNQSLLILQRKI